MDKNRISFNCDNEHLELIEQLAKIKGKDRGKVITELVYESIEEKLESIQAYIKLQEELNI